MALDFVNLNIDNGIGYVTFSTSMSNSLPGRILNELASAITQLSNNIEAKVIVLQSEGDKAFCAGASFDELIAIEDFETGKEFFSGFAKVINAIRTSPKFVIVRVHSKAVGGGVGLAASGDYTFAVKSASAKLSELALGIGPFVVGPAVERKIGKSAYSQMSIDYDWYSAEWCYQKGLYNQIFENTADMDTAINELATKLANNSTEAMADLKKVLWQGTENWDTLLYERAEISGRLVLSDFTKEYISKFKAKK
jgi:methylglutaconyl-CoA hydratase